MPQVILALGANIDGMVDGAEAGPVEGLGHALGRLKAAGVEMTALSSLYRSPAVGPGYQPAFYNAVLAGVTAMGPQRLLRELKQMERAAGRRGGLYWGPRPLDVDIIDYGGAVRGWGRQRARGVNRTYHKRTYGKCTYGKCPYGAAKVSPLAYPHLLMHRRVFVLKPLDEIKPGWRHPVLEMTPARLMARYCSPLAMKATEKLEKTPELWQI